MIEGTLPAPASWDVTCARRVSPDTAETPDRRSPLRLLGMIQEAVGLLNRRAMKRMCSDKSLGWSGAWPTTRIGIESNRKTNPGGDLRSAVTTGSGDLGRQSRRPRPAEHPRPSVRLFQCFVTKIRTLTPSGRFCIEIEECKSNSALQGQVPKRPHWHWRSRPRQRHPKTSL